MAEIRKHNPEAGNAIAQALRAALGEQPRPNVPGESPSPAAPESASAAQTSVYSLSVRTTTVAGDNDADVDDD